VNEEQVMSHDVEGLCELDDGRRGRGAVREGRKN
jgi:hypothetical protein